MEPEPPRRSLLLLQCSRLLPHCACGSPFSHPLPSPSAPPAAVSPFALVLRERPVRRRTVSSAQSHLTCLLWRQWRRQKGCSPLPCRLAADLRGGKLVSNNAAILTRFLSAFNRFLCIVLPPPTPTPTPLPTPPHPSIHRRMLADSSSRSCLPSLPRRGAF